MATFKQQWKLPVESRDVDGARVCCIDGVFRTLNRIQVVDDLRHVS